MLIITQSHLTATLRVIEKLMIIFLQKFHGFDIPKWAKQYMNEMKEVSEFMFKSNTLTSELKRLRGGPLIKKITTHMERKVAKETNKKMFLYAGHDSNIANLLNSVGAFNYLPPPYASTVIVELHEVDSSFNVQV